VIVFFAISIITLPILGIYSYHNGYKDVKEGILINQMLGNLGEA
jgi:hypothetical protein